MQKISIPINIKPDIYFFIKNIITDENKCFEILQKPKDTIQFLVSHGIFENAKLLENVIFQLKTQEEVLITNDCVLNLQKNREMKLICLYDKKEIAMKPSEFKKQFAQSDVFDYIEKKWTIK